MGHGGGELTERGETRQALRFRTLALDLGHVAGDRLARGSAHVGDVEVGDLEVHGLTLGSRRGFVRVALDNEADLVPVLGFGENDVYDTVYYPPNTWQRTIQETVRKKIGFATPIFYGRGIFNYSLGILPHRKPIIVVVGKPIKLPKLPDHLKGAALSTTKEGVAIVDKSGQCGVEFRRCHRAGGHQNAKR